MDWIFILKLCVGIYIFLGFIIFIYGVIDDVEKSFEFDMDTPTCFEIMKAFLFCVFISVGYIVYLISKHISKNIIEYLFRKVISHTA